MIAYVYPKQSSLWICYSTWVKGNSPAFYFATSARSWAASAWASIPKGNYHGPHIKCVWWIEGPTWNTYLKYIKTYIFISYIYRYSISQNCMNYSIWTPKTPVYRFSSKKNILIYCKRSWLKLQQWSEYLFIFQGTLKSSPIRKASSQVSGRTLPPQMRAPRIG